ncbi:hypothetical protein MUP77_13780, partial [Candidatus Bathyarchaeota archaeon]|nr:hypothetical protein [Candidatus Bathyarchaeota archaeon]
PRDYRTKLSQREMLARNYSVRAKQLIIFLVPGHDLVNGGILSISSIYEETKKMKDVHSSDVVMCTIPGDPPLLKYTKFKNDNFICDFSDVLLFFRDLESLTIHIPEYCISQFLRRLTSYDCLRLKKVRRILSNVLLQNIDALPSPESIEGLKRFGNVTFTTAHERYTTLALRKKLGVPLHKLSVHVSPEKYDRREYTEKEDLMIVSEDWHPKKERVLSLLMRSFPKLRIQIVKNITYEEYKDAISRAKWALTFGEGLDGYFVETVFSGGISFSVYNSRFFTEDFRSLRTVYDNYDVLIQKICSDISDLDNKITHAKYQNEQFELCHKYYDHKQYIKNIESFYKGEYTYKRETEST